MYNLFYFLHIIGIAVWLGSLIALGYVLNKLLHSEAIKPVLQLVFTWINRVVHLSAFAVLISGVYMIMQFDRGSLPFYLIFMEQLGSLAVLFSVIILTLQSRKIRKKLEGIPLKKDRSLVSMTKMYTGYMYSIVAMICLVIGVVAFRIA